MNQVLIQPGAAVRYLRTGTSGIVPGFADKDGTQFLEPGSKGFLYRLDQLIPAEFSVRSGQVIEPEQLARLEQKNASK